MQDTRRTRPTLAVGLIGVGGLLVVIGSILPFVAGSAGGPFEGQTSSGLRYADGRFDLGVGIGLVVIAILIQGLRLTLFGTRILSVIATVAAAIILYATIIDVSNVGELPEVEAGIGLYFVLAGSAVALVGGVLGLIARGRAAPGNHLAPQASMPPPPPEQPPEPASS
jgi:hypothetical protein